MLLQDIVPWGRTAREYQQMFDLCPRDLNLSLLGCGDGPASFNAQLTAQGCRVVSVDPIYHFSKIEIARRVEETYATVLSQVAVFKEHYVWQTFATVEELGQARMQAMEAFLADYELGKLQGRYLPQALPDLDFVDNQFDLSLCSHLLFLYSEHLSQDFHEAALRELLRVSAEVRVFPLLTLKGSLSAHLLPVTQALETSGFTIEIRSVGYEFQKGGNQMLRIYKEPS